MGKIVLSLIFIATSILASDVDKLCLNCHRENKLPTKLIYKRYLLRYSTKERIKNAIFTYLKEPNPKNSIMPQPFFDKFNKKPTLDLNDSTLKNAIDAFIEKYDIKKQLR